MTVADMTPMQLYAVVLCALVVFELAKLGISRLHVLKGKGRGPQFVAALGVTFLVVVPILIALDAMAV